ncbi:MAG: hemolysin family protein [Myxococcota bacterium]
MDWHVMVTELASFGGALLGMAFISSVETALTGMTEAQLVGAKGRAPGSVDAMRAWLASPGPMLASLHFLRIATVLAAGIAGYRVTLGLGYAHAGAISAVGGAVVALVLGHLVPRALAKRHLVTWALATVRVVRLVSLLLSPIVWPLFALARAVARAVGLPAAAGAAFWVPGEIGKTPNGLSDEALGRPGVDLLRSIIEFSDTVIREIMVPRTEMVTLPVDASREDVLREAISAGHSRIPVYDDTVDNVLGLLHLKDLFAIAGLGTPNGEPAPFELRQLLRRTFYVPEIMQISELLREFQRRKTHMAIVVDEYGGTAGVVTLEDIIEEIVGDIQDEYDVEEKQFRVLSDTKVIADGRVSLWDLEEPLGVTFPAEGGYETLAGFLMFRAGYLPEVGTVLTWKNLRFTVKEANQKQVRTVEIERRKVDTTTT